MTNCEKYIVLQHEWSVAACSGEFEKYKELAKNGVSFRNNEFSKSDWEELIAQSSGRAKYEYTRMMKEKFPD